MHSSAPVSVPWSTPAAGSAHSSQHTADSRPESLYSEDADLMKNPAGPSSLPISPSETVVDLPGRAYIPNALKANHISIAGQNFSIPSPAPPPAQPGHRVNHIARRIHGWTWQAFPIGMGTSAVYVTISGLRDRTPLLMRVETAFFFINLFIFTLNVSTLAAQAICEYFI